jgi:catechol 2,3-dioxygenase-like lactoylglutathione lyase family enzyme
MNQTNVETADKLKLGGAFMARIRHLAILTEDVEKLVNFYTNSFGLKIVKGVGTATYLTDGHLNLAIIPIGPEREIEGNHLKEGINHFGFEVDSVDELIPVCKKWGASVDVTKRPPNREAEFRVHDPDGNPVDLSQHGWPH